MEYAVTFLTERISNNIKAGTLKEPPPILNTISINPKELEPPGMYIYIRYFVPDAFFNCSADIPPFEYIFVEFEI